MSTHRIVLPDSPRSAGDARRFVTEALASSKVSDCTDAAVLLTSELVANAVLHAHSPVEVQVRVDGATVRIDVLDDSAPLPEAPVEGDTFSGRGLQIVQAVAGRWGATPVDGARKSVWFELSAGE